MSRLATRDPAERGAHNCHQCPEPARYIHKHQHWCRTCLDVHDYPQFAHLTQPEREQLRLDSLKFDKGGRGVINAKAVADPKPTGIGFAVAAA